MIMILVCGKGERGGPFVFLQGVIECDGILMFVDGAMVVVFVFCGGVMVVIHGGGVVCGLLCLLSYTVVIMLF